MFKRERLQALLEGGLVTLNLLELEGPGRVGGLRLAVLGLFKLEREHLDAHEPICLAMNFSASCMLLYGPSLWSVCSGCMPRLASVPG